jgi:tRNA threonylcarbamoyladenosine biosynthesis protein TsaB
MANLLIVDASSALCSVSLISAAGVQDLTERQPRRHAQRLLPMIDEVLQVAGVDKTALDGLAFARGPGSFTGIRIAVSVIQGIALGLNLPVYGFSTLQLLAQQALAETTVGQVVTVLDAHMGEVFWAVYERNDEQDGLLCRLVGAEQVSDPQRCVDGLQYMLQAHQIDPYNCVLAGNGVALLTPTDRLPALSVVDGIEPLSHYAVDQVANAWQRGEFAGFEDFPPVYLRDSVAWKKLDEQPSLLKR